MTIERKSCRSPSPSTFEMASFAVQSSASHRLRAEGSSAPARVELGRGAHAPLQGGAVEDVADSLDVDADPTALRDPDEQPIGGVRDAEVVASADEGRLAPALRGLVAPPREQVELDDEVAHGGTAGEALCRGIRAPRLQRVPLRQIGPEQFGDVDGRGVRGLVAVGLPPRLAPRDPACECRAHTASRISVARPTASSRMFWWSHTMKASTSIP